MPDAWRVSGYGTAGVVRWRPNGRTISTFAQFSLINGGIENMWGFDDHELADIEDVLATSAGIIPPVEEGPEELAADFIAGAYALSQMNDMEWDNEDELVRRYLGLMRPPGTDPLAWFLRFVGPGGLAPAKLWRKVAELIDVQESSPKGRELAIATMIKFEGVAPSEFARILSQRDQEFVPSPNGTPRLLTLYWMRQRKVEPGRKVPHGEIVFRRNTIEAAVGTLSMASICVECFKQLSGGALRVKDVAWKDWTALRFPPPGASFLEEPPGF
jgi:hypothetical protein